MCGKSRPILLVTGFGPFPGVPFNVSAALAEYLASQVAHIPARLHMAVLPTHWRDGPALAVAKIRELQPDAVVLFGVSRRARGFQLETRAYNHCARIADCAGTSAQGFYVRRGGPPILRATLPILPLMQRLRLSGLPVNTSKDPGRYLCNATLYNSLNEAQFVAYGRAPLVGFVHIPALSADRMGGAGGGFGWPELQRGAVEILRGLAACLPPFAYTAGRHRPNRINTGSV